MTLCHAARAVPIVAFPDPRRANRHGLLAVGGDLEPESLILAYRSGIFPWPTEGMPLPWFCPPRRAILEWSRLHLPRSLRGARNRGAFRFTVDQAFPQVIDACAHTPRDFDHDDPMPGSYTLEVTSPGLERTLRTPAHFQREVG